MSAPRGAGDPMGEQPESVGDILSRELATRGWTQGDFAEIIDRPAQLVSEVMTGKKELTRETASQFAAATGTSPKFWLAAQDSSRLWLLSRDPKFAERLDEIRERASKAEERHRHGPHIEALCVCGDPWCDTTGKRKPHHGRPQCPERFETGNGGAIGCLRCTGHKGPHQGFWKLWPDVAPAPRGQADGTSEEHGNG